MAIMGSSLKLADISRLENSLHKSNAIGFMKPCYKLYSWIHTLKLLLTAVVQSGVLLEEYLVLYHNPPLGADLIMKIATLNNYLITDPHSSHHQQILVAGSETNSQCI